MALDHYVSQVHLRNFYSPILGERFYVLRKSDRKSFTANSESVCRIQDGSTNAYLTKDRAVEDFLKGVEPRYNASVSKLQAGQIDPDVIYVIAGFASYVLTCSPAAMRLHAAHLKAVLESSAEALDMAGALPPAPESLGGGRLSDLIRKGTIRFKVDEKYPQAIGISNIQKMVKILGNSVWEVLSNPHQDIPFFTSDFPAGLEQSGDPRVVNHIVPLTPFLAVRIRPDISLDRAKLDLGFGDFRSQVRTLDPDEVRTVNRLIVQSAEDLVIYRDEQPWVKPFFEEHRLFGIETRTQEFGDLLIAQQRIVERA